MKAVFTCDDVFDVLTREPFPSGGDDDELVESHLAVCHECRQLAEAFRPAVGLFHESMSVGLDDELPSYCGRLTPIIDALPHMPLFAPRQDVASRSAQRRSLTRRSFAVAASLLIVGSAVFATLAAVRQTRDSAPLVANLRVHEHRDHTLLAALEIPSACRSTTAAANRAAAADVACCTKCHTADSPVASTRKAIVKSSAACVACHDGRLDEAFSAIEYDRMWTRFRKSFDVIKVRLARSGDAPQRVALVALLNTGLRASRMTDAETPPPPIYQG
ncbi:MAG: hypothetical protein O3C40_05265 [Planctomycetota bacterium]|nr:hypothetical protein [Planctomycetota bacterium]